MHFVSTAPRRVDGAVGDLGREGVVRPLGSVRAHHVVVRHEHHRRKPPIGTLPQKRNAVAVDQLQFQAVEHARIQAAQQRDEPVERAAVGIRVVQAPHRGAAQHLLEALDRGVVATHVRGRQRVGDRRGLEPHRVHHQHDGQHDDDGKDNGKHDHEDSPFDKHMPTIIAAPPSESPQVAISAAEKRMVLLVPSACNGTKAPLRYPPINQGTEITGQCGQDTLVPVLSYFI